MFSFNECRLLPGLKRVPVILSSVVVGLSVIFSLASGVAALSNATFEILIFALAFLISLFSPSIALVLFFFALPFFGNRPGTEQALSLDFVLSGLVLGAFLRGRLTLSVSHPVEQLALLFTASCFFSLLSLDWPQLALSMGSSLPDSRLSTISFLLGQLLSAGETSEWYSVCSAFRAAQGFSLFLILRSLVSGQEERATLFAKAITFSMLFSIGLGIADYYGGLSLSWLRALDPITNWGNNQFRLQSTFGHSGWYGEYLLLSLSALLLAFPPAAGGLKANLKYFLIIALTSYAAVLTFQRGAWLTLFVSVPSTLLCLFVIRSNAELNTKRLLKLLFLSVVCLVAIALLAVALTLLLLQFGSMKVYWWEPYQAYLDRLLTIGQASDRLGFILAGIKLGLLEPFLGLGVESFSFRFKEYFINSSGVYYGDFKHPLHGSAHSLFAQIFAGVGLSGLLPLLLLLGLQIRKALPSILNPSQSAQKRAIAASALVFSLTLLVYGVVQEFFYVNALRVLFFSLLAINVISKDFRFKPSTERYLFSLFLVLVTCGIVLKFIYPGDTLKHWLTPKFSGCEVKVLQQEPITYWCGPNASLLVTPSSGTRLTLIFHHIRNTGSSNPATTDILVDGSLLTSLTPTPASSTSIRLPDANKTRKIEFRSNHYFLPARDLKDSTDKRVLSFQLKPN